MAKTSIFIYELSLSLKMHEINFNISHENTKKNEPTAHFSLETLCWMNVLIRQKRWLEKRKNEERSIWE